MAERYQTKRRVEFRDTDAAGIMHFSTYFTYMEEVEHEFLRSLGWSVVQRLDDGRTLSWPRVSAKCDYRQPSKFEDLLQIELRIERIGTKSVTYGFTFRSAEAPTAEGFVTAVCCEVEHGTRPRAVPIPETLRQQLERFAIEENSSESN